MMRFKKTSPIENKLYMPFRTNVRSTIVAAMFVLSSLATAQTTKWTINPKPTVTLGHSQNESADVFSVVTGATLLSNGNIMVGDRADFSMRIFSPNGKEIKKFGRKGHGPGEITMSVWMMRCGENVVVYDTDGDKVSVFTVDGIFRTSFRFSTRVANAELYPRDACNQNGLFVHYGWDTDSKQMVYRSQVPVWITPTDSSDGKLIGRVSGSERWGGIPLPMGRETHVAISRDKVFVGEGTTFDIKVFSFDGKVLPSVTKPAKPIAITAKDKADDLERAVAAMGEKYRKTIADDYAKAPTPKTFPAYRALIIDSEQNLWVQDYAPASATTVIWTVFSSVGKQISELQLPFSLEVYEIGKDYILGRYVDADESIPEVRLYRLNKAAK